MTAEPSFEGRRALVMGANAATAAAIALALAQNGADVAVTSTTGDAEEAFSLRGLRRSIEAAGRRAIADIADLGNGSSVQIAVRQIAKQFGGLDLLVVAPHDPFFKASERITDAEWARVTGLNLGGYFYACRAAVREMRGNSGEPKGRIIALLPSTAPEAGNAAMLTARAGAEALIQALAGEWAADAIFVAAVCLSEDTEASRKAAIDATLKLAGEGMESTGQVIQV